MSFLQNIIRKYTGKKDPAKDSIRSMKTLGTSRNLLSPRSTEKDRMRDMVKSLTAKRDSSSSIPTYRYRMRDAAKTGSKMPREANLTTPEMLKDPNKWNKER